MKTELEDWRVICEAASNEQAPDKLMALLDRLDRAFEQRETEINRLLAA